MIQVLPVIEESNLVSNRAYESSEMEQQNVASLPWGYRVSIQYAAECGPETLAFLGLWSVQSASHR